ncbi:TPA: hypothetical protein NBO62_001712 [Staphylococcus aureus]|uniref:hypothetical protein n=1 Tax=Staphylococcus aureus TaxID=1280 RepID=UPI00077BB45B|nr:hypothetical protein [Staphylococcus aureus]HAY2003229.1 hypothetical protein [Staphylococcus aureus]HBE8330720.1 hypothetical protein [Staphylococcus aureus]HCD1922854.1 hypothetical protein [Staphylococcus aureus]HCD2103740.1 hypothetical protein [Staphylococcus aureus]HCD2153322.1 hypothetical protein [Staphylococcus aureus]
MRTIILSLFIIMNIVAIIMTLSQPLTVNYFSLRVILIFFILIKSSRLNNILTILSIVLVIIHMGILAHSTYVYLY